MKIKNILFQFEQFLFYSFLIVIPFSLRHIIYYPGWKFNEWLSVSIWATDLLIISLLCYWFFNNHRDFKFQNIFKIQNSTICLLLFLLFSLISIKNAPLSYLGWYHWIKLCELLLLFLYLKNYAFDRFDYLKISLALMVGGFFQSILGISQFLLQKSLGLTIFGEGFLDPLMKGIAVFYNFDGERVMRAYGTTPHPNILAGYLLVVIFALYYLWLHYPNILRDKILNGGFIVSYGLIIFGFLLTFSRTAIFFWAMASLALFLWFWLKVVDKRSQLIKIFLWTLCLSGLFLIIFWPEVLARVLVSKSEEAVQLRVYFAQESIDKEWNIFGVGIGNFVKWLMDKNPYQPVWMYQPVHNIYLLIYSEVGIMGILSFISFLFFLFLDLLRSKIDNNLRIFKLIMVLSFLAIGFFDHYLVTMQDGGIILWSLLALIAKDG